MSLRAIQRRDRLQKTQQQRKNNNTDQIRTSQLSLSRIKRSQSCPNLFLKAHYNEIVPLRLSKSEADIASDSFLLNAKSEVCLKTITVRNTVPPKASSKTRLHPNNYTQEQLRMQRDLINQKRRMSDRSDFSTSRMSTSSTMTSSTMTSELEAKMFDPANIRIPIIGYEVMEERARFTIFKLRIENSVTNTCWLVLRRYTDFVRLNNKLKSTFPKSNLMLPRKKWFGDNFSSGFIDNRIQGLQIFVNSIMSNETMRTSTIVKEFFCLEEPPTYSESMEECRAIFEAQEETISHLKQQLQTKDDLILVLQTKLMTEFNRNEILTSAIKKSFGSCSKCSKQIDNHLKESTLQQPSDNKLNSKPNT